MNGARKLLGSMAPMLAHELKASLAHFHTTAQWIARHTGIPAILVASLLIVLSWRMAKRMAHVAVEVAIVAVVLVALTKLGALSW